MDGKAQEEAKGGRDPEMNCVGNQLYLCPEICPTAFPNDQKKEEVEFANPRSFLGEISPTYW